MDNTKDKQQFRTYIEAAIRRKSNFLHKFESNDYRIPNLVHASVKIINRMKKVMGINNICVFPISNNDLYVYFALDTLLSKMQDATFSSTNNTQSIFKDLQIGQRLLIGDAIVEFHGAEQSNEDYFITLKCKDTICKFKDTALENYVKPIRIKDKLSSFDTLNKSLIQCKQTKKTNKNKKGKSNPSILLEKQFRSFITNNNNVKGTIVFISPLPIIKQLVSTYTLYNYKLAELLKFGTISSSGDIKHLFSSKTISGKFDILIAQDLESIYEALKKNDLEISNIIIDLHAKDYITPSIHTLEQLMMENFPITALMSNATVYSIDTLIDRDFNIWNWKKDYVIPKLDNFNPNYSIQLNNYRNKKMYFINCLNTKITSLFSLIDSYDNTLSKISDIKESYVALKSHLFKQLRCIYISEEVKEITKISLKNIYASIRKHKESINKDIYNSLIKTVDILSAIIEENDNDKIKNLIAFVSQKKYSKILFVIPDDQFNNTIKPYWNKLLIKEGLLNNCTIEVLTVAQYLEHSVLDGNCLTVIPGWLKSKIMRLIYSSNITNAYATLLYPCEHNLKEKALASWKKNCFFEKHQCVLPRCFPNVLFNDDIKCTFEINTPPLSNDNLSHSSEDILDEIDLPIVFESNYIFEQSDDDKYFDIEKEVQVKFTNGITVTYPGRHKFIVINDIISDEGNLQIIKPIELEPLDYILERESEKSIIREIADNILKKSNLEALRDITSIWQKKLQNLKLSEYEIYKNLIELGCSRNRITIHNWLTNEDMITPQSFDDLSFIASLINDSTLNSKLEEIYNAGVVVKNAHIEAGKYLTKLLKAKLKKEPEDVVRHSDNLNIPIEVDNIGTVYIYQVTSISY